MNQRESVKLKGSVKKGKQEPRDHHQTQHSPNSHALFTTKIGFHSHQRTHKHTRTLNIQDLIWSFSVMRDEQSFTSKQKKKVYSANLINIASSLKYKYSSVNDGDHLSSLNYKKINFTQLLNLVQKLQPL